MRIRKTAMIFYWNNNDHQTTIKRTKHVCYKTYTNHKLAHCHILDNQQKSVNCTNIYIYKFYNCTTPKLNYHQKYHKHYINHKFSCSKLFPFYALKTTSCTYNKYSIRPWIIIWFPTFWATIKIPTFVIC